MVFDKKRRNGLGGAEGGGSLLGFGMKNVQGWGPTFWKVKMEVSRVSWLSSGREWLKASESVWLTRESLRFACKSLERGVGGRKLPGAAPGRSEGVLRDRRVLSARKPRGEGCLHQRLACVPSAERRQGPSHCPPHSVSVAQRPKAGGESLKGNLARFPMGGGRVCPPW